MESTIIKKITKHSEAFNWNQFIWKAVAILQSPFIIGEDILLFHLFYLNIPLNKDTKNGYTL